MIPIIRSVITKELQIETAESYENPLTKQSFKKAINDPSYWRRSFCPSDLHIYDGTSPSEYWLKDYLTIKNTDHVNIISDEVVVFLGEKRRFKILTYSFKGGYKTEYSDGEGAFSYSLDGPSPYRELVGVVGFQLFVWVKELGFCSMEITPEPSLVGGACLISTKITKKTDLEVEVDFYYYISSQRCYQKCYLRVNYKKE